MNPLVIGAGVLAGLGATLLTRSRTTTDPRRRRQRMTPASAPAPGADPSCLVVGRDNPEYPFGPYRVCLTKTQRATLFGRRPIREIKCGTFACAYDHPSDPTKVVKITRDDEDLGGLLRAQGTGLVPDVYEAHELRGGGRALSNGRKTRVYAAVLDRLQLPAERGETLTRDEAEALQYAVSDLLPDKAACCDRTGCNDLCLRIAAVGRQLHARGIDWIDTHAGNVGYDAAGNLRVLDLGRSEVPAPALPVLAARRRRQARGGQLRRRRGIRLDRMGGGPADQAARTAPRRTSRRPAP
jgi:hypothetical protein